VTKDSVRSIDLSVVVPENLKDQNGRVYLRKGQVVNPLEKMAFTNAVIVFNGAKPKEIAVAKLLKKQSKEKGLTPILITTGLPGEDKNALGKLYNEFGDWVYFLDKQFKERFSIKSTPSMVVPDKSGKVVVVEVAP
jgi:conjugal transfer pilus assembly protein TraW